MSINNSQQISDIKTMLVKGMNGEGIESIEKTATEGFIDTYTITYTDGTKTTFDVTNGNWGIWTPAMTAAASATSVTINNDAIGTTSILEVYSQNASGTVITVNDIDVTPGTAVLTFPALAEATDFILHIVNGTASGGGGGGGGTTDYLDLTNKPQINGVTLTGNKATSDFGLVNTFQGTIAEWNQLTTAEKKAYDHASITGTGGGEYNVNRTTGNLILTAGVPATYPASQVTYDNTDSGLIATHVQGAVDEISENIVKQTTGTSITLNTRCTLYHDGVNYYGFIMFPFVAKNVNYTVQITTASQDNVGNVLGNTTVVQKLITGFNLKITGAYEYTKCGLGIGYTITFA